MLIAVVLAVVLPGAVARAQTLDATFARLDKTAQQFRAFSADIHRDVHTAIVNDDAKDGGTIRVKRDKAGATKMLIDFTGTDAKTVAFDGANASVYYPKIKTVQIYDVGAKRSLIDQFLLLGFGAASGELKTAYDIAWVGAEAVDGKPAAHVQLVPKSKEVLNRLKKADLWISDASGLPVRQRFTTSNSGDFMMVDYTNSKLNPEVAESALKLNLPKGVKVERPQL